MALSRNFRNFATVLKLKGAAKTVTGVIFLVIGGALLSVGGRNTGQSDVVDAIADGIETGQLVDLNEMNARE